MSDVDIREATKFLINCDCRPKLAAELYNKEFGTTITEADILEAVIADGSDLSTQLRTKLMLKSFQVAMKTQVILESQLAELKDTELARLYLGSIQSLATLTSKPVDDNTKEPTNIMDARRALADRLADYKSRRLKKELENEAVDAS